MTDPKPEEERPLHKAVFPVWGPTKLHVFHALLMHTWFKWSWGSTEAWQWQSSKTGVFEQDWIKKMQDSVPRGPGLGSTALGNHQPTPVSQGENKVNPPPRKSYHKMLTMWNFQRKLKYLHWASLWRKTLCIKEAKVAPDSHLWSHVLSSRRGECQACQEKNDPGRVQTLPAEIWKYRCWSQVWAVLCVWEKTFF